MDELQFFGGLNFEEIAVVLDVSEQAGEISALPHS
jgi:hypothetical protein